MKETVKEREVSIDSAGGGIEIQLKIQNHRFDLTASQDSVEVTALQSIESQRTTSRVPYKDPEGHFLTNARCYIGL